MRFVVLAWALSRAVVAVAMAGAGAHLDALANWDGAWYGEIAKHGYRYANDGRQYDVAFFPLFPSSVWPLVHLGIAWPIAAAIVANLAFLAALALIYRFALHRYDEGVARWSVALAAFLPPSLFCSVAYPQSLFMLCSVAALESAERSRYAFAGIAGAFASAASGLGIALAAAMLVDGVARKRRAAVVAGIAAFAGIGCFAFFCYLRFGDALAFVHAQRAWRHGFGFDAAAWRAILSSLSSIEGIRQNVMMLLLPLGALAVVVQARRLGRLPVLFALVALGVLAFAGTPFSVDRNSYAVVPVIIAVAAALRRLPPAGYAVVAASVLLLAVDAARFARFLWVA